MADLKMLDWPPNLDEQSQNHLIELFKNVGITLGFAIKTAEENTHANVTLAPITLFPSIFPNSAFKTAKSAQKTYNKLYASIASDITWLEKSIEKVVPVDDFVQNLWKIHQELKEDYSHKFSLGLFRSDYMVHYDQSTQELVPKQVEFNTIASSFGGLSAQATKLHKAITYHGIYDTNMAQFDQCLPPNPAIEGLSSGIIKAHNLYCQRYQDTTDHKDPSLSKVVLFVTQNNEKNIFDQQHLEYQINLAGIQVHRVIFQDLLDATSVDDQHRLIYHTPAHLTSTTQEVSVVYYRAGYAPTEYHSERDWQGRAQVEKSRAIKCPTVLTQLTGLKKVQQVLATPSSTTDDDSKSPLSHFFEANSDAETLLRRTFVPIYPLDDTPAGQQGRKLALDPESAHRFVLKPQREGGGNNIYRSDIPKFLSEIPEKQWEAYILMEMIETMPQKNIIHRNGETRKGGVICELGIFGVTIWEREGDGSIKIHENYESGHLLRTKGNESHEGGVAAGFGALDSPYLVPDEVILCSK